MKVYQCLNVLSFVSFCTFLIHLFISLYFRRLPYQGLIQCENKKKKDHQQHRLKAFLIEFRMVFNKLHPIEFQIDVIGPFSFSSFSKVLKNYSEFLDLISFTKQIVSKNQTKLRYHTPQKMKFP